MVRKTLGKYGGNHYGRGLDNSRRKKKQKGGEENNIKLVIKITNMGTGLFGEFTKLLSFLEANPNITEIEYNLLSSKPGGGLPYIKEGEEIFSKLFLPYNENKPINTTIVADRVKYGQYLNSEAHNIYNDNHYKLQGLHDAFEKYIKIKPEIIDRVEKKYNEIKNGVDILVGIFVRSNALGREQPDGGLPTRDDYMNIINNLDKSKKIKYFLRIDNDDDLNFYKNSLTPNYYSEMKRSLDNKTNALHITGSEYLSLEDLEDIFCEVLLLSKCDTLIHCASNMVTASLLMNMNQQSIFVLPKLLQKGGDINYKDITIGILSWKDCSTIINTLESYKKNGLLDLVNTVIFFQEISDLERSIAEKYNIKCLGSETNIGIQKGFSELINNTDTKYFIFAESDFELIHNIDETKKTLEDSIKLLKNDIQIVKLRDRKHPGEPYHSKISYEKDYKDKDILQEFPYKLEALSYIETPENIFPNVYKIVNYNYKWYIVKNKDNIWSNNIFIGKTEWIKNNIISKLNTNNSKNKDKLERDLINNLTNYNIAAGDGLFKHNRLSNENCDINLQKGGDDTVYIKKSQTTEAEALYPILKNIFSGKNIEFVDDVNISKISVSFDGKNIKDKPFIQFSGESKDVVNKELIDLPDNLLSLVSTSDSSFISDKIVYFPMFLNVGPFIYNESPFKRVYQNNERPYIAAYIARYSPEHRDIMFKALKTLDNEDKVHALGTANHTKDVTLPRDWWDLPEIYKDYLFGFAMENKEEDGYITEKIMNVYRGGSIPIYWGTSKVKEIFNPDSFIYVNDYESFEKCAEDIMNIVNDKERLRKLQQAPIFKENAEPDYSKYYDTPSPQWVIDIAEKIKKNMLLNYEGGNEITKAYVINLDKRTDRWEQIQKDFKDSTIVLERVSGIENNDAYKGCSLSFQKVVKMAKDTKLESVLIFEDDNKPLDNFNERWIITKKWLDNNMDKWDIFNGSARIKDENSVKLEYKLNKNINLLSCTQILDANWLYINKSSYDKILNWVIDTNYYCLDRYIGDKNQFKTIFIFPFLGIQNISFSNTTMIMRNDKYEDYIQRTIVLNKILNLNSMKAYVINLDRRTDRWEQIQKDFKDLPIVLERFSAIENKDGHLGLGLSYLELVKKAKNENMDSILILEDDCLPVKDFINRWKSVKKWLDNNEDKWEVFNGCVFVPIDAVPVDTVDDIPLIKSDGLGARAAHFVIIKKSAYDRVLEWNKEKNGLFDYFINSNVFKNILLNQKVLAGQHKGFSNTEKINRNTELNKSNLKGGQICPISYFTVSTKDTPELQRLKKSSEKFGWNLDILGLEENTDQLGWEDKNNRSGDYGNFSIKLVKELEYVSKKSYDDIVLFTDAWDVICLDNCNSLYQKFLTFNKDLVFGAEKMCSPDADKKDLYKIQNVPFPYLNSGFFIGKAGVIKKYLETYNGEKINDQKWWTATYLENQDEIALDSNATMCLQTWDTDEKYYQIQDNKFTYTETNTNPNFVHANGHIKDKLNLFTSLLQNGGNRQKAYVMNLKDRTDRKNTITNAFKKEIIVDLIGGGNEERTTAYVLNLIDSIDRKNSMIENFKDSSIDLEFIYGKQPDGSNKNPDLIQVDIGETFKNIIKEKGNNKPILIFEDDCKPINDFSNKWQKVKVWLDSNLDKWEIFSGGVNTPNNSKVTLIYKLDDNIKLFNVSLAWGTQWTYINPSVFSKVLEFDYYKHGPIDKYLNNLDNFNLLVIYPFIGIQDSGYSTIQKRMSNKSKEFVKNLYENELTKQNGGNRQKAYVMNLKDRTEKWEDIQNSFKDIFNLERFDAIKDEVGHRGCGKSFQQIIKIAKEKGMEEILILEDDCKPLENFKDRWNKAKYWLDNNKDKWEVFNGGLKVVGGSITNLVDTLDNGDKILSIDKGVNCHMILVKNDAYDKILKWNWDKNWLIDFNYINTSKFKTLFVEPVLSIQKDGYSNTEHIDKKHQLGGKSRRKNKHNRRKTRKNKQRGGSQNIHYITVSTKDTPDLQNLIKSAKKNGWDLNVLGLEMNTSELGHANKKFGMKLRLVKDYLSKCNPEDLLLFTDAWDVLVFGNKEELLERYKKFNKSILFNAEKFCWPDDARKSEYDTLSEEFPFLNSGGYIGKVKDIAKFLGNYNNEEDIDDQRFWTDQYMKNKDIIGLDHKNEIFICCVGTDIKDYSIENEKLKYKDRYPLILHANGPGKEIFINPFL